MTLARVVRGTMYPWGGLVVTMRVCGTGAGVHAGWDATPVSFPPMAPATRNGQRDGIGPSAVRVGAGAGNGEPMSRTSRTSTRTTDATPTVAPVAPATITRPSTRGDWIAVCPADAFTDAVPASGAFATVIGDGTDATVRVRFGGRAGAMIAAMPDDNRAAVIVASVGAMRDDMGTGYGTFARPGAIDSPAVARAVGIARDRSDGSTVRDAFGRIAASRRVDNAPAIAARAADAFGTSNPYGDASDA